MNEGQHHPAGRSLADDIWGKCNLLGGYQLHKASFRAMEMRGRGTVSLLGKSDEVPCSIELGLAVISSTAANTSIRNLGIFFSKS